MTMASLISASLTFYWTIRLSDFLMNDPPKLCLRGIFIFFVAVRLYFMISNSSSFMSLAGLPCTSSVLRNPRNTYYLFCEVSLQVAQLFLMQLLRHIGIDIHCSRYILMTKDILYELDIRTGFTQPCCKGMTLRKYVSISRYTKCRKWLKRQAIPAYKNF